MEALTDFGVLPQEHPLWNFPGVTSLYFIFCWLVHSLTVTSVSVQESFANTSSCFVLCERTTKSTLDCSARNITGLFSSNSDQLVHDPYRSHDPKRTRESSSNENIHENYLLNGSTWLATRGADGRSHCAVSIKVLNLHNNLIHLLPPAGLGSFVNLERLNLSRNIISHLPNGTFSYLRSLLYLDISENNVSFIEPYAFQGLEHLRVLNLKGNRLLVLDTRWVGPLAGLLYLNMAECNIKSIPAGFITALTNVTSVDLSYNGLQVLYAGELSSLRRLEQLALEGNPLRCDCQIVGLQRWLKDNATRTRLYNNNLSCASPGSLAHHALLQISEEKLTCNGSEQKRAWDINRVSENPDLYDDGTLLPYDPMMGLATAATLSGMLVLFLMCVGIDKTKRYVKQQWRNHKERQKRYRYHGCRRDSQYKLHECADDLIETMAHEEMPSRTNLCMRDDCDLSMRDVYDLSMRDDYDLSMRDDYDIESMCSSCNTPIPPAIYTEDYSNCEVHVGLPSDDVSSSLCMSTEDISPTFYLSNEDFSSSVSVSNEDLSAPLAMLDDELSPSLAMSTGHISPDGSLTPHIVVETHL